VTVASIVIFVINFKGTPLNSIVLDESRLASILPIVQEFS
jgi:hypothetical protein